MNDERRWWIGPDDGPRRIKGHDDPLAFAKWLSSRARAVRERDGTHASMVFFHLSSGGWVVHLIGFSDQGSKALLWEELAVIVSDAGHDAYVFVGEAWSAPEAEAGPNGTVQHSPSRRDVPMITADASDGRSRSWVTPFRREGNRVLLEATREDALKIGFSEPIRRVWSIARNKVR